MTHSDFFIGLEFLCGGKRWRCTDVGSRTIAAICLSDHEDDGSWYNGPPYAVAETVFDEYDVEACENAGNASAETPSDIRAYLAERDRAVTTDELTDVVLVRHHDGSILLYTNALLEERQGWLLLFGEHQMPALFHRDDVDEVLSSEARPKRRKPGGATWHYQAYRGKAGEVQLYEDYHDESGRWQSRTEEAVAPMGDDLIDLTTDLAHMLFDAMVHPVKQLKE
ncbi:MAG: hypothetical protein ACOC8L_01500 [Spirochaetota bacterium]